MPKPVALPIRTQYYQFDQQGVVFNMWYLAFIEEARNAYLEAVGFSLGELLSSGHDIQVVHTSVDWTAAVRFGDDITVEVRPGRVGRTSFGLEYDVKVAESVRARSNAIYVIVDRAICGKAEMPARLRAALTGSC